MFYPEQKELEEGKKIKATNTQCKLNTSFFHLHQSFMTVICVSAYPESREGIKYP